MRAVVQRVKRAEVTVEERSVGRISHGLCVLVGVMNTDTEEDAVLLARKIARLRIFTDAAGKMNLDVSSVNGSVLAVSQFTLAGDARSGHRPSFTDAMAPARALPLFDSVCLHLKAQGIVVETGEFGADMQVSLQNDGPVTLLLDTKKTF